ncbi:MAG: CerR family C-terminal domain-containing protein [Pseudomonadota bacterium]|nr:CerR family C-terminal domain-containing protein [Pseudomonadota bacterium]
MAVGSGLSELALGLVPARNRQRQDGMNGTLETGTGKAGGDGSADATRLALVEAALDRFGAKGYDAASTREIAAAAGANIASIAYHFGGKEGLRRACAEHVAGFIGSVARAAFGEDFDSIEKHAAALPPGIARVELEQGMARFLRFLLLQPQTALIVRFLLREITHPSATLDIIYTGVFLPVHRRLCALWGAATARDAGSQEVRLAVFAMIGQATYFRIAQEIVQRRMDWPSIGPQEVDRISEILIANLRDSLDRHARDGREQGSAGR